MKKTQRVKFFQKYDKFSLKNYRKIARVGFCKKFGIGISRTLGIITLFGLNKNVSLSFVPARILIQLLKFIRRKYRFRAYYIFRFLFYRLKVLFRIKSYKGRRHRKNLPVRGQRSHTNRGTQKKIQRFLKMINIFSKKRALLKGIVTKKRDKYFYVRKNRFERKAKFLLKKKIAKDRARKKRKMKLYR